MGWWSCYSFVLWKKLLVPCFSIILPRLHFTLKTDPQQLSPKIVIQSQSCRAIIFLSPLVLSYSCLFHSSVQMNLNIYRLISVPLIDHTPLRLHLYEKEFTLDMIKCIVVWNGLFTEDRDKLWCMHQLQIRHHSHGEKTSPQFFK